MEQYAAYLFFGPTGSGKSTQQRRIYDTLNKKNIPIVSINTGLLIREFSKSKKKTEFSKKIIDTMNKGKLVPSSFPVWLWMNALIEQYHSDSVLLVDGGGRSLVEADLLLEIILFMGIQQVYVIVLEVSEEETIQRLSLRDRNDDIVDSIRHRLGIYNDANKGTIASINYLEQQPSVKLFRIDGVGTEDEVYNRILQQAPALKTSIQ